MPGRPPNRRVDQTIDHIARGWIPVNPVLLKEVQEKLSDGEYQKQPELLLEDLKRDPGLFVHTARNLKSQVEDVQAGIDPLAAVLRLEEEKLRKIFLVSEKQVSEHRYRDMRQVQALRMEHSIISSRAAEALASRVDLPPNLAFSTAFFRQLGHSLVAWNYPDIYARALSAQRNKGVDANLELKKFLGVTPLQIGAKYATEWSLDPELRAALVPRREDTVEASQETEEGPLLLRELCEIADLFAQANDPDHYPAARQQWKETEARLSDIITPQFFKDIEKPVLEMVAWCEERVPKIIVPAYFHKEEKEEPMGAWAKALYTGNSYIRRCPEALRKALTHVYTGIKGSNASVGALRELVEQVVPLAGFKRGCLYFVNKKTTNLEPALGIGDLPCTKYPLVRLYESHPVAQSLATQVPFKQEGEGVDGTPAVYISGAIGSTERPGVLYLEIAGNETEAPASSPLVSFQAIRQCLIDCLGSSLSAKKS